MREDWVECCFEDLLGHEQPTKYIVKSTAYNDAYETPVLTAGKSFIKGYTNETDGIFDNLPTIIFDDFTTASQFVNFKFKVKSSAMKILVPTSDLVNMNFAYYAMQVNQIRSDTHKRYWISVYAKKEFLLPSLLEQRAIVAKIETLFSDLDKGIADITTAQAQLKVYRQAVLKKAFEGELTKGVQFQQSKIGDYCKIVSGKAFKKSEYSEQGVRLFQIANVSFNKIIWDKVAYLPDSYLGDEKLKALILEEGDLVMALNRPMLNNELKIGILGELDTPSILYQRVGKFLCNTSLSTKYLLYFLQSPIFIKWLSEELQGVNIPFINQSNLLGFSKFPFVETEVQHQIVRKIESCLSVCDKVEESLTESLEKAKTLRQSILKKAFEGSLLSAAEIEQCKQAADYEPASALLAKIKAEKKQ